MIMGRPAMRCKESQRRADFEKKWIQATNIWI